MNIKLLEDERAITLGQSVVLYDGDPNYVSYLQNKKDNSLLYNSNKTLYYDNFLTFQLELYINILDK